MTDALSAESTLYRTDYPAWVADAAPRLAAKPLAIIVEAWPYLPPEYRKAVWKLMDPEKRKALTDAYEMNAQPQEPRSEQADGDGGTK